MGRYLLIAAMLTIAGSATPAQADGQPVPPPPVILAPGSRPAPMQPLNPQVLGAVEAALARGEVSGLRRFFTPRSAIEFGHYDLASRRFVRESVAYGLDAFAARLHHVNEIMGTPGASRCHRGGPPALAVDCLVDFGANGREALMVFGEGDTIIVSRIGYVRRPG